MHSLVFVVGNDPFAEAAVAEIRDEVTPVLGLHVFPSTDDLHAWSGPEGATAALVVLMPGPHGHVDDLIDDLLQHPACEDPHILLLTSRPRLDDIARALDHRLVHGVVAAPWTPGSIARYARAEISRWQERHPRDAGGRLDPPPIGSEVLRQLELPIDDAAGELLAAVEETLGHRPRIHLPAGVRITHEASDIDHIYIVVSGRIQLNVRSPQLGSVTLNHESTGPVVGLMALADRQGSLVTAQSTTPVEIVQLTLEQLDMALEKNARVGTVMTALVIRALTARLRRAQYDRVEKTELAKQLQVALGELENARADLVAQARMVTLGELAAGIAHELNNPVAAMGRSLDHLLEDLPELIGNDDIVADVLADAGNQQVSHAADDRAARRRIEKVVKDPVLARRLVEVGITDPRQAKQLSRRRGKQVLERLELAAGIGSSLRSLTLATQHITSLVDGLRRNVRPDDPERPPREPIDAEATVDAAILMLGHRLKGISTSVDLEPDLPKVMGSATELTQVWVNLLANAADVLDWQGKLTITISTCMRRDIKWVRVQVRDNGPGIPEDVQQQIFEPRFTTKHGVVRFGLGLGLNIARTIVEAHEGSISLTSRPGDTCFEVLLPAIQEER